MAPTNILVTTDNFWIGGRETFLLSNLELLRRRDQVRVRLLANDVVTCDALKVFDEVKSLRGSRSNSLKGWLAEGIRVMQSESLDLIWAQHYQLLSAWILSVQIDVPLLVTFHGPLLGPGAPTTVEEALGAAIAIHRGGILSAVSHEIAEQLFALGAPSDRVRILPNKVPVEELEEVHTTRRQQRELRLVMLTRPQKLGHIRAGAEFLHAVRRSGYRARLTVYSGYVRVDGGAKDREGRHEFVAARRLGRKWLMRNPKLWSVLRDIEFCPPTDDPARVIADADIVVGMGRVVLEGLAARRPTVLIGYEKAVGVVSGENFDKYGFSNFSGRGLRGDLMEDIAAIAVDALSMRSADREYLCRLVDIERSYGHLVETLDSAARMRPCCNVFGGTGMSVERLLNGEISESSFLNSLRRTLSRQEAKTFTGLLTAGGNAS